MNVGPILRMGRARSAWKTDPTLNNLPYIDAWDSKVGPALRVGLIGFSSRE